MANTISVPVSAGELLDKISILKIKIEMIEDTQKLKNVKLEHDLLIAVVNEINFENWSDFVQELYDVNLVLWKIEDDIRLKEKAKQFDAEFTELARSVYRTNDRRFDVKNKINKFYGLDIREEKSYESY
jgi:hypothetical protein